MTEEEIRHLQQAYAELKEEAAQKDRRIEELEGLLLSARLCIEELKRRLAKDSHNSSKPPSSDGLSRKAIPRQKSGRASGGQTGHQGHVLQQVAVPDQVIIHRPTHCEMCQCDLSQEAGQVKERRQIHELPALCLVITEHQVQIIGCPACGHLMAGTFPASMDAPAQYGPRMRALVVYLSQFQLLPMARIRELMADLWGCHLSEGTVANWIAEAARTLEPSMLILKRWLLASHLDHVDETGIRVKGLLHWVHVTATKWLTVYSWYRKRGQEAMDAIGLLPQYQGRAIHDRWHSYDHYPCQHSVCGAHLLRDCLFIAEQEKQPWAQALFELLVGMSKAAEQWRAYGATAVPKTERDEWIAQHFSLLAQGFRPYWHDFLNI